MQFWRSRFGDSVLDAVSMLACAYCGIRRARVSPTFICWLQSSSYHCPAGAVPRRCYLWSTAEPSTDSQCHTTSIYLGSCIALHKVIQLNVKPTIAIVIILLQKPSYPILCPFYIVLAFYYIVWCWIAIVLYCIGIVLCCNCSTTATQCNSISCNCLFAKWSLPSIHDIVYGACHIQ